MQIKLLYKRKGLLKKIYPFLNRKNTNAFYTHPISLEKLKAKGSYKDFFFRGIYIGYSNFSFINQTKIRFDTMGEMIKMHFVLSGNTKMTNTVTNQTNTFEKYQHNLIYTNSIKNNWEWESNNDLKLFEVYIKIDFFKKYICENESYLKPFTSSIQNRNNSLLAEENLAITPEMYTVIENIINCNRKGVYKKMFFEAQIIQLLLLQLEQVCCNNCAIKCSLKRSDINKMHQVKDIMLSNLNTPHTLLELAHQVGTNEFTLKKGFKTIFGNTVFGYLNEAKMAKAQKMLIEQGLSVTQVAEQIGYKNATHFTTAFKKKYGILPSTLKSEIKN